MPEQDWTFYCDFSGFETTSVFSDSVTQQLVWFDDSRVRRGTEPAWNWHLRIAEWADTYLPWLLTAGPFHLSRSMQSDVGNFVLQNMSGTSLERDMNKLITASAFEGALFAFREWNLDAQKPEFEMHGH